MNISDSEINAFFDEYIYGFIYNDVKNAISTKANYVVATSLVIYTEYIGGLITGTLGLEGHSQDNFNAMLSKMEFNGDLTYYSDLRFDHISSEGIHEIADVYKVFRCGFVHEYFFKGVKNGSVLNDPDDHANNRDLSLPQLGPIPGIKWNQGKMFFFTNGYWRDLMKAIESYHNDLLNVTNIDLRNNFETALQRIANQQICKTSDDNFFIYFPQWQGSGSDNDIYNGAKSLKKELSKIQAFWSLDDFENNKSRLQNEIQNYSSIMKNVKSVKSFISSKNPKKLFLLGGDCGIDVIPISYLKSTNDLSIVWIDAHGDINTPVSSPSKTFHGMPLRTLLGEGDADIVKELYTTISPEDIIYIGVRDLDKPEEDYISLHNIKRSSVSELSSDYQKSLSNLLSQCKSNVYIHIDLDVLDPKEFKSVKCPTSNGFAKILLLNLVKDLTSKKEVVGGSIVEFTGEDKSEIAYVRSLFEIIHKSVSS